MQENSKQLFKAIENGITTFTKSDVWKEYLNTMSKFHNYSFNNTILIYLQRPDATYVAGFQKWKKTFHRYVKKGEKGIRIFAPIIKKVTNEDTNERETIYSFKTASVFDIKQTDGEPLPEYINDSFKCDVKNYNDFLQALKLISPVPIHIKPMNTSCHGLYDSTNEIIEIRDDLTELMTIKTCLHEIAHAFLHNKKALNKQLTRNIKETEAESVAYAVCRHYDLDTSEYSFPYLAGWSTNHDTTELQQSFQRIQETTSKIIQLLDTVLKH